MAQSGHVSFTSLDLRKSGLAELVKEVFAAWMAAVKPAKQEVFTASSGMSCVNPASDRTIAIRPKEAVTLGLWEFDNGASNRRYFSLRLHEFYVDKAEIR